MARTESMAFHKASGKVGEFVINQIDGQSVLKARSFRNSSRTDGQVKQRAAFGSLAATWQTLTPMQKNGWLLLGKQMTDPENRRLKKTLGAYQAFTSVNGLLLSTGGTVQTTAPDAPQMPAPLPPVLLDATRGSGVTAPFTLTLRSAAYTGKVQVFGAAPALAGQDMFDASAFKLLGTVTGLSATGTDITALYAACFGIPAVGEKVALRVAAVSSAGFRSLPLYVSDVVAAPGAEASGSGDRGLKAA